jgi:hypothetical protein
MEESNVNMGKVEFKVSSTEEKGTQRTTTG